MNYKNEARRVRLCFCIEEILTLLIWNESYCGYQLSSINLSSRQTKRDKKIALCIVFLQKFDFKIMYQASIKYGNVDFFFTKEGDESQLLR